jgi:adenylylsulfate kinase-like enzyme
MLPITPGHVFWITGYSGAGKTTVAHALQGLFRERDRPALLLDGDVMRAIFGGRHGFSREDRLQLATSYSHLCEEVSSQGIDVICATISLFHQVQRRNRERMPNYHEILLSVPVEVRAGRDPKGLYRQAAAAGQGEMGGVDQALELPERPDLVIDNHGAATPLASALRIWRQFLP